MRCKPDWPLHSETGRLVEGNKGATVRGSCMLGGRASLIGGCTLSQGACWSALVSRYACLVDACWWASQTAPWRVTLPPGAWWKDS